MLRIVASNIFYLFSHILSLNRRSSHVAAVAAHRRSSTQPASTVAAPRRIGSSLAMAKISILLLSFLSLSFCYTRRSARSPRGAATRCAAPRVRLPCAARHCAEDAALLLLCYDRRLPHALPAQVLIVPSCPAHLLPAARAAAPRTARADRPRLARLSRPPAHRATRAACPRRAPSIV